MPDTEAMPEEGTEPTAVLTIPVEEGAHDGNGTGLPGMSREQLLAGVPLSVEPKRLKKVAVLGFTNSWKLAPFDDPEWEIWGLNELYMLIPRWTRWFEIHRREIYETDKNRVSDHVKRLQMMTVPVYMQQHWDDIPQSVQYPLTEVINRYGDPARPYLTNSISYMIALAMLEGFEEIGVFGVDMAHDTEYCLGAESRVLTEDLRWVPIGNIQPGQVLVGFDEDSPAVGYRKYRSAVVEDVQYLTQPSYRLYLADGTTIVSSEKHRWLSGRVSRDRRWVSTEGLQEQVTAHEKASKLMKLMPVWDTDNSWEAGYLAAAYDGEGHLYQDSRRISQPRRINDAPMALRFTQNENAMAATVERTLTDKAFAYARSTMSHKNALDYSIRGGRSEILRFLGSLRPQRLLEKFNVDLTGGMRTLMAVPLVRKEFIGDQPVVGLKTSTRTFIAEGFASHNSSQRPSCEYFIGYARGMGIKVTVPPESDLLKAIYLYGYQDLEEQAFHAKLRARKDELTEKLNNLDGQIANLTEARAQYRGAIQDADHIMKIWAPNQNLVIGNGPIPK